MKRLTVLIVALLLMAGVAHAQYLDNVNEIGLFMVENPTPSNAQDMTCWEGGAPGQFTVYVVLSNAYNENLDTPIATVGGFEFRIDWPADSGFFVNPVVHPSATNFLVAPEFFCGANIPVVNGQCTLVTIDVAVMDTNPRAWFIGPVSDPDVHSIPNSMAITDLEDAYSISEANPAVSYFGAPVFSMFDCDVVPNEDASWGEVKSMYR